MMPKDNGLHIFQWSTPSKAQSIATVTEFARSDVLSNYTYADIEWTLRHTRKAFDHRIACVLEQSKSSAEQLKKVSVVDQFCDELIFIFTGQGSQYSGMAAALYVTDPEARAIIEQGCDFLKIHYDIDLLPLLMVSSEENDRCLADTALAQPALFILAMSSLELWKKTHIVPISMLGHSLGEYAAACFADVWDFNTALELVYHRGRLMSSAKPGAMLACNIEQSQLTKVLGSNWQERVDIAVSNAKDQLVLSIDINDLSWLCTALEEGQIRFSQLKTSHAYHSRSMDHILSEFKAIVANSSPKMPSFLWMSNLTAVDITTEQAMCADYWGSHLRHTVRFDDALSHLVSRFPSALFVEIGPKQQLTSLIARKTSSVISWPNNEAIYTEKQWFSVLAQLWCYGFNVDWDKWNPTLGRRAPLPGIALNRHSFWAESYRQKLVMTERIDKDIAAPIETLKGTTIDVRYVWSSILGIKEEALKGKDNFFALGGSSIDLLDLVREISNRGGEFTVSEAYQYIELAEMESKVNNKPDQNAHKEKSPQVLPFSLCRLTTAEQQQIAASLIAQGETNETAI
ncbi:MAG: acyltransferase domain-containing protein [Aliivibrio sp.]|uniref:acyl carrier protein n=1 Tax=Aliivibrio sp. TaxID=1872443 RepID=UPI001A495ACD|nr:acyltransferase domain-containing protein [Aliivibrio sp.]